MCSTPLVKESTARRASLQAQCAVSSVRSCCQQCSPPFWATASEVELWPSLPEEEEEEEEPAGQAGPVARDDQAFKRVARVTRVHLPCREQMRSASSNGSRVQRQRPSSWYSTSLKHAGQRHLWRALQQKYRTLSRPLTAGW